MLNGSVRVLRTCDDSMYRNRRITLVLVVPIFRKLLGCVPFQNKLVILVNTGSFQKRESQGKVNVET